MSFEAGATTDLAAGNSETRPDKPRPEEIDARFAVERTLGRGGMGVVYLAWDQRLERRVALKLVTAVKDHHGVHRHRLDREARALAKLSHPNVVPVFEVGEHEGELYVAMEYVEGQTLRAWCKEEERAWAAVVEMFIQAGRGLAAAHAAGLLHRDFKPDNAIVGTDGRVRVLDFGLARALSDDAAPPLNRPPSQSSLASTLTDAGAAIGTPAYMAPEQFLGETVDERTDLFAFCVALYEALFGRRPFEGKTRAALVRAVTQEGPSPAPKGVVPAWLSALVMRGLQADREKRPASIEGLLEELDAGLKRRRRRVIGVVAALGLAAAASVGWGLSSAAVEDPGEPCEVLFDRIATPEVADAYSQRMLEAMATHWRNGVDEICDNDRLPAWDSRERRCLEAWLPSYDRSVALLEQGDEKTRARAPDLLSRIIPPDGDYCALEPSPVVDPEVWTLAERAREAATLGDAAEATRLAAEALARAKTVDAAELTPHQAEALAATAETEARAGDFAKATASFAEAEHQAIATDHRRRLVQMRLLWAKVEARLGVPEKAEGHLSRAESLSTALGDADSTYMQAELAEARGVVWRAKGDHTKAIEAHQVALQRFAETKRPLLAARALLGKGASHQYAGNPNAAKTAYEGALDIYNDIGVGETYRNRVKAHLNLGYLGLLATDARALDDFDYAVRHGSDKERLGALASGTNLAVNLDAKADAERWAARTMEELQRQADAPSHWRHDAELAAGVAIFGLLRKPEGERVLQQAETTARSLSLAARVRTQQGWVDWLPYWKRCDEARTRLTALDELVASGAQHVPGFEQWRNADPLRLCTGTETE